jgi:hypothetical protein
MHRRPKFWVKALGLGLVFLCFGISCERELSDSIEPVKNWRQQFLQDGDQGVDLRSIIYVELPDSINPDSANPNTVKLFQASGYPLLASAIVTGEGAEVPPDRIDVYNLESGKGAYLAFDPSCDLFPLTDYRLELKGLLLPDGSPMPDLILHFTTGPLPPDYLDPFYCEEEELVLPLMAYDLSDLQGINGGLAGDTAWDNSVANLVAVGITKDPPTYQNISDSQYSFGYSNNNAYNWADNRLASPPPTPYTVLVYITNRSGDNFNLSDTPGWFNVRPYWFTTLLDSFTTVDAWTSSDPVNTPVALETGEYFEGFFGMGIGLNGTNSLGDTVSRPWSGGFPADTTGIMFAFKMGNVISGDTSHSQLELQLRDGDGNVIGSNIDIAGVNTNWGLFTRVLSDDFVFRVGTTFNPTTVDQISLVIVKNNLGKKDLVGDLFVDFLTIGDMPNLAVYYPPEVITPEETLPLYVDQDGSTYWAYDNNGVHILNLVGKHCDDNCPLLDPDTALTPSNLAQAAP